MNFALVILVMLILTAAGFLQLRTRSSDSLRSGAAGTRRPRDGVSDPPPPDLRRLVLGREFLREAAKAPDGRTRAVVMDWTIENGVVTLVAFDDGTTSLYTSMGGGVLGAGALDTVRQAATSFRAEAERVRSLFAEPPDGSADGAVPLPPPVDTAAFYLVSDSKTLQAGPVAVEQLAGGTHELSALGSRAQAVIAAIRQSTPQ